MANDDVGPVSWSLGRPGCGANVFAGFAGRASPCGRPVGWTGLVLVESRRPVELWVEYACDDHVGHVLAPRRPLDRDRTALEHRRTQQALAQAGRIYDRAAALATGAEARDRLRRALAQYEPPPAEAPAAGSAVAGPAGQGQGR